MWPGVVPLAGTVIVTSGSVRRSGRERYFGGPASAAASVVSGSVSGAVSESASA
jgi:hypothetical protein